VKLTRISILLLLLCCILTSGCSTFTRTIYVPDGTPVRLRETVKGVKVWVLDAEGVPVAGTMDLPEGWYALPMPPAEPGEKGKK
jgi:uncharacterized protein YceK